MEAKKLAQIKYIPINLLKEWDLNPRKNDSAVDKLSKLIESHGFINPVIATKDNIIRAGHTRVKAAKKAGLKEVPVILIDMDEKQAQAFAIADNKSSEWAEWDFTKLKDLIEELDDGQFDLELTGFDTQEIENLMTFVPEVEQLESGGEEDDFNAEPPKTPITVLGDLYELNKHRLHCADSTDITAVEKLMNGKKADMVFTDPPYGVDYEGINNDSRDGLENLLRNTFTNYFAVTQPGGSIYCFHSDRCADIFHTVFREFFHFSSMIIWNKNSLTLSQTDYQSKHEPCLYGWMNNGTHKFYGDRKQVSVWDIGKEYVKGHTTPKPIELIVNALNNSSLKGHKILDLFLGSGSTLIASEQLNRVCYGQELDPKYCDVIIKRYVTYMRKENKPYTIKRNDVILSEDEINKYFEN